MSLPLPNSAAPTVLASSEFSPQERSLLLRLAHQSILSALQGGFIDLEPPPDLDPELAAHLAEHRGAFTTLYAHGQLRGCVGYVLPSHSLYRTVAETARAAALEDTRFAPVTLEEAWALRIELSILSTPQPISPELIEVGRHGLLVSLGFRRGLLLPQVATEHHWDRTTFLEQTCRKAGLPLDAWKAGALVEAFTAEVFGEMSSDS